MEDGKIDDEIGNYKCINDNVDRGLKEQAKQAYHLTSVFFLHQQIVSNLPFMETNIQQWVYMFKNPGKLAIN